MRRRSGVDGHHLPGGSPAARRLTLADAIAHGQPGRQGPAGRGALVQVHNESNWFGYEEVGQGAPRTIRPAYSVNMFTFGDILHDNDERAFAAFKASGGWRNPAHVMHLSSTMITMLDLFRYIDAIVADVLACADLRSP
ncbi:MAG TPA: hypothetical protein VFM47_03650 [Gaiellales bacterium]|nr:hypothetical protein [Gaiellales bacterium]